MKIGVGKSSFISSADAAVQGYLTEIARSGKGSGSLTKELMSYSIFSKVNNKSHTPKSPQRVYIHLQISLLYYFSLKFYFLVAPLGFYGDGW